MTPPQFYPIKISEKPSRREPPYIDIHTHGRSVKSGIRIISSTPGALAPDVAAEEYLSLGIHPWLIPQLVLGEALAQLESASALERVVAIGECGLDRLVAVPLGRQSEIFVEQLRIAERVGKPLIVHCVRAFDELNRLAKSLKPSIPMILHGFDKRRQLAHSQLRQGFYLSFGAALTRPESNGAKAFRECPVDRVFLETDDSGLDIERIYAAASALKAIDPLALKARMHMNFQAVFPWLM